MPEGARMCRGLIGIFLAIALVPPCQADMAGQLEALRPAFLEGGGSPKALAQVHCFLQKHGKEIFRSKNLTDKESELQQRCNHKTLRLQNERAIAIVDYTQFSHRPRFYLFDLRGGRLHFLHTAHGRYGDTDRANAVVSYEPKRNSVRRAVHFSNDFGSNASAGGFYLTGDEYIGKYQRSLVLHGLEEGFNDNSCGRTTVIHKSSYITDGATARMSSGCPMVAVNKLNFVVDSLVDGALVYLYTPVEAALGVESCGRNLLLQGAAAR